MTASGLRNGPATPQLPSGFSTRWHQADAIRGRADRERARDAIFVSALCLLFVRGTARTPHSVKTTFRSGADEWKLEALLRRGVCLFTCLHPNACGGRGRSPFSACRSLYRAQWPRTSCYAVSSQQAGDAAHGRGELARDSARGDRLFWLSFLVSALVHIIRQDDSAVWYPSALALLLASRVAIVAARFHGEGASKR
jgi:hypothetical protein